MIIFWIALVLSCLALIEGFLVFFFPDKSKRVIVSFLRDKVHLRFIGLIEIIVGIALIVLLIYFR